MFSQSLGGPASRKETAHKSLVSYWMKRIRYLCVVLTFFFFRNALDKVVLSLSVGHCKMYGLESAATAVSGSSEERGQKPVSVLGHFQPLATGIAFDNIINE